MFKHLREAGLLLGIITMLILVLLGSWGFEAIQADEEQRIHQTEAEMSEDVREKVAKYLKDREAREALEGTVAGY